MDSPVLRHGKARRFIDRRTVSVNVSCMDLDEVFSKRPGDPLTLLAKQDLDPLSVEELDERVEALKREIARVEARRDKAASHRANAESLFKR
jgi:uncharacterized small protein (DUF1192 family)